MTNISRAKRVLLKLSGETLIGEQPFGIDSKRTLRLAISLKNIAEEGYELGIVIGGGNIFRGIRLEDVHLERSPADQMGMLATLMNGIALQQALTSIDCPVKLMSGLECPRVAENYHWEKANAYLSSGNVVIFVGGTGSPYFTTDTAAALRACEIKADVLLKATKVDGVYSRDPYQFPDAKKYTKLSYEQYLQEKIGVMDITSIVLCMNSKLPVFVFNMQSLVKESLKEILSNPENGTLITEDL